MNGIEKIGAGLNNGINNIYNLRRKSYADIPFKSDSFEQRDYAELHMKDKNKLKTLPLWLIGGGLAALLVGGGILLRINGIKKQAQKMFEKNLFLSNLPEKIEFKQAKTLEEARKFTKEVLGIKNIDTKFTLEGLNYVNEAITRISNANKGKVYLPPKLEFINSEKSMIAGIYISPFDKEFGTLTINSKYFDSKFLDDKLANNLMPNSSQSLKKYKNNENGTDIYYLDTLRSRLIPFFEEDLTPLFEKYYADQKSLTIEEKRFLWTNIDKCAGITNLKYSPLSYIHRFKDKFEEVGIKFSIEEIMKKTKEEQLEFVKQSLKTCDEKGSPIHIKISTESPLNYIYHELGHWQDLAKNLKPSEIDVGLLKKFENRWGALHYKGCKEAWEKGQDYFKKEYPELYEFLTNQQIQLTASEVSNYAQTGIGEFVAEVYSALISGKKLSDKVMNLYKKYNGPMPA